jgi:uncharacterized protein YcbK (DUF882 family)
MGDLTTNLSRSEFACHCTHPACSRTPVDFELPTAIQECVDWFLAQDNHVLYKRIAVHINSGYRCTAHNNKVTDSKSGTSTHTLGMAADLWMEGIDAEDTRHRIPDADIASYFESKYPTSHGIGRYPRDDSTGRTHFDVRSSKARWVA